ncbi:MAG: Rpn family recombination-promoting nuclease/putative transposase [Prevotellaceae bacterium]|jgi:hypothetical protein|nr:Rpn family recombination-promoting nuclease/putative transposase [Prevotellaceae bacterium]
MATNYIRFDWAVKNLLRQKANFVVLEGFLTVLLKDNIKILSILESEANQESNDDKFNRVDMLAENDKGELIIIEVQNSRQVAYYQRMLYGTSKAIVERIKIGEDYAHVRKVYSINILYFALGYGKDYVYHGKTEFRGLHYPNEILHLSEKDKQQFHKESVGDIFPEYYIIRVDDFDKTAVDPLDQWISFLKTSIIPDNATAPGLDQARTIMALHSMSSMERADYERHLENLRDQRGIMENQRIEGREEGLEEGRKEGMAIGRKEGRKEERENIVKKLINIGIPIDQISTATNLAIEEIAKLLK